MATGPILAVAMIQKRIVRAFREAGATDPSTARTLQELRLKDSRLFRAFAREGTIVETDRGFYLDVPHYEERRRARKKTALILVSAVVIVSSILLAFVIPR